MRSMIRDIDHHAEALAAMRKAIAADCPTERLRWLEAAAAWKTLALLAEQKAAA